MKSKLNISKKKAKELALKDKKKLDKFFKQHWLNSNDPLTLILKTHLYIEVCLNHIFVLILPKPNKLLKNIKGRVSIKIDILEALGIQFRKEIVERIRITNKIRNRFAHNLNKKLELSDVQPLIKNIKVKSNATNIDKLKLGLSTILGYLHCLITINKIFPFIMTIIRNNEIFKKDKGYSKKKILSIYPIEELEEVLDNLKMPEE